MLEWKNIPTTNTRRRCEMIQVRIKEKQVQIKKEEST